MVSETIKLHILTMEYCWYYNRKTTTTKLTTFSMLNHDNAFNKHAIYCEFHSKQGDGNFTKYIKHNDFTIYMQHPRPPQQYAATTTTKIDKAGS